MIGVAIMMFADRYYVKGKRLVADNLPKEPVEYVNPYMGNISHLLVPTYPTVHLPNSMLRAKRLFPTPLDPNNKIGMPLFG